MLEILGTALASKAVEFVVGKAAEGALQSIGSDAYKVALKKLNGFFSYKFGDCPELENADSDPAALVAVVEQKILSDKELEKDLSKLVLELQKVVAMTQGDSTQISQGEENISIVDSTLQNVNQSKNSAQNSSVAMGGGNSGNININRGDSFRP